MGQLSNEVEKKIRKKIHEMKPNEWYDGAGNLQSERWVLVELHLNEDQSRVPEVKSIRPVRGTRVAAEMDLQGVADMAYYDNLAIARIYVPSITIHNATVKWY